MTANCDSSHLDFTRKELKINLRFPRALNSGWLSTNPPEINELYNCKSDLGTIGVDSANHFPSSKLDLAHGHSYTIALSPHVLKTSENIRQIAPKL